MKGLCNFFIRARCRKQNPAFKRQRMDHDIGAADGLVPNVLEADMDSSVRSVVGGLMGKLGFAGGLALWRDSDCDGAALASWRSSEQDVRRGSLRSDESQARGE